MYKQIKEWEAKWQGIEKLAEDLEHLLGLQHSAKPIDVIIAQRLRRALEPLLEAAENVTQLTKEPGRTLAIAQLKEEIESWRK